MLGKRIEVPLVTTMVCGKKRLLRVTTCCSGMAWTTLPWSGCQAMTVWVRCMVAKRCSCPSRWIRTCPVREVDAALGSTSVVSAGAVCSVAAITGSGTVSGVCVGVGVGVDRSIGVGAESGSGTASDLGSAGRSECAISISSSSRLRVAEGDGAVASAGAPVGGSVSLDLSVRCWPTLQAPRTMIRIKI